MKLHGLTRQSERAKGEICNVPLAGRSQPGYREMFDTDSPQVERR